MRKSNYDLQVSIINQQLMVLNFYEEFQRLILDYPAQDFFSSDNTDFLGDYSSGCKNSYMVFDSVQMSGCVNAFSCGHCTDCADIDYCAGCENLTNAFDCFKCSSSSYLFDSFNLMDCKFCHSCHFGHDLFGCVGLSNEQYCFFNKKMSKEDYKNTVAEVTSKKNPHELLRDLAKLSENYPLPSTRGARIAESNSEYSDYVDRCQNTYMCFNVNDSQNLLYCNNTFNCDDSTDLSFCDDCNDCYNCADTFFTNGSQSTYFSNHLMNSMYCYYCRDCQHCLGCVGLSNVQNCVLNRQVGKEQIEKIREGIMENPNIEIDI